ncbi:DUF4402 domain-containing protein [Negadavirga shengliensis]|uniref:DUF4402 domain-containing protein n=1 Tax=Negadavirga shengliensis TaxID=1389218 RepID=A0ABV9SXH9_9BACT
MFCFCSFRLSGQIQVYNEQPLSFGSFIVKDAGGTVHVSYSAERTATGDIILINQSENFSPLVYGIEAPIGTLIHIQNGPDMKMYGDNGGELTVSLGASDKGTSFVSTVAPPDRNLVYIEATISVNSRNITPPGNYAGSVSVTFIQE